MKLFVRILLPAVLVVIHTNVLEGKVVLFDERVDVQQKTEIQYDVPDGCVVTGLGFRAHYDNITTMYCRYHRLMPNGTLAQAKEIKLGSEPEHACEAKILLPNGWVAVGFGTAGEPEWDVTLLRVWARELKPDGTLGEIKVFNDGFKPEREPERHVLISESNRALTGVGLRFHFNDIQGIYARSKGLMNLDADFSAKHKLFTERGWILEGIGFVPVARLKQDLDTYKINRLDIQLGHEQYRALCPKDKEWLHELLQYTRFNQIPVYIWLDKIEELTSKENLTKLTGINGLVINLKSDYLAGSPWDKIQTLVSHHSLGNFKLSFRLPPESDPEIICFLPEHVPLVLPVDYRKGHTLQRWITETQKLKQRSITFELDLTHRASGLGIVPEVRLPEIAGCLVRAIDSGAKGFTIRVNSADRYVPDTVNGIGIAAAHRLANDPFQSVDTLWQTLCKIRYGDEGNKAVTALKRTGQINDLIFQNFHLPVLWHNSKISSLEIANQGLQRVSRHSIGGGQTSDFQDLIEPTYKTLELATGEKETAQWLIVQSLNEAQKLVQKNPSQDSQALQRSLEHFPSLKSFWNDTTQAYILAKIYAFDGTDSTRSEVEAALQRLVATAKQIAAQPKTAPLVHGLSDFLDSIQTSLEKSKTGSVVQQEFNRVKTYIRQNQQVSAAAALAEILNSARLSPYLKKQDHIVGEIVSQIKPLHANPKSLQVLRGGDGKWTLTKINGHWAFTIGKDAPCIYFNVPGPKLSEPATYKVTFDYFDQGDWRLHFHYDSDYPPEEKRQYHPVTPLQLTNTRTWKQGSFVLPKCLFSSAQNLLADMRFVTGEGAWIRNVQIQPQ